MTITTQDLPEILENHRKWLRSEPGGVRANLSRANLYGADLSGANLSGANLYGAYLSNANLSNANLSDANLSRANLYGANLSEAHLYGADLSGAYLYGANLGGKAGKLVEGRNFLQLGPIGSRNDYALFFKTENGLFVRAGCFFDTISAFAKSVRETHAGTDHETHYKAAIALAKKVLK